MIADIRLYLSFQRTIMTGISCHATVGSPLRLAETRQVDREIVGASGRHVVTCGEVEVVVCGSADGANDEVLLVAIDNGVAGQTPSGCGCRLVECYRFPRSGGVGVDVEE